MYGPVCYVDRHTLCTGGSTCPPVQALCPVSTNYCTEYCGCYDGPEARTLQCRASYHPTPHLVTTGPACRADSEDSGAEDNRSHHTYQSHNHQHVLSNPSAHLTLKEQTRILKIHTNNRPCLRGITDQYHTHIIAILDNLISIP